MQKYQKAEKVLICPILNARLFRYKIMTCVKHHGSMRSDIKQLKDVYPEKITIENANLDDFL